MTLYRKFLARGRSSAIRVSAALALLVAAPLLLPAEKQAGGLFAALADDDDTPGSPGAPGGAPGAPGAQTGNPGEGLAGRRGDRRPSAWERRLFGWLEPRRRQRVVRAAPPARPAPQREYVVWAASEDAASAIGRAGFRIVARGALTLAIGEALRVRPPAGMGKQTALQRLAAAAPDAVIAENHLFRSFLRPSGTRRGETGRPIEHAVSCSAGATVAMIDTALDRAHPALAGRAVLDLTMRAPDRQPSSTGHGTAVASMLIGRRDGPAPGLAPEARLIAVDAFHRSSGGDAADAYDLVRALDLVATQEVLLVNMSLTGPENAVVAAAIQAIQKRGAIIVAAAGNDGPRARPLYPAAYPGVIAVAAVDAEGRPWRRSASGRHITFTADGVGIALAGRAGGAEPHTGTSFAAPVVTAMLAGKRQNLRMSDPDGLTARLAAIARDSGEPGRDPVYGFGIVTPKDGCR